MSPASKSVYFFGFYLLALGVILIVLPNTLLTLFQMPETTEVWIRVVGVIVFGLGQYYVFMAPANNTLFMMITVYTRAAILIWFILFVAIGWAPIQLILFGLVDMAGATWTFVTLKKNQA